MENEKIHGAHFGAPHSDVDGDARRRIYRKESWGSMDNNTFDTLRTVMISPGTVSSLVKLGDGNAALLYLYLVALGANKSSAEKVHELGWDAHKLAAAENRLALAGLLPNEELDSSSQLQQKPAPAPQDSGPTSASDSVFYALVKEVQSMLGKVLSSDDIIRLLGIYDTLRLPGEVILQLVYYCIAEAERNGNKRMPSLRTIEKTAYTWEREGIYTLEAAERYIKQRDEQNGELEKIARILQLGDRDLMPTERKYIDSWLALGYGADTIAIAYERMIMRTGKLAWQYINTIIVNWHDKNLHTAAEILEKDTKDRAVGVRNVFSERPAPDKSDMERMERFIENMKKAKD